MLAQILSIYLLLVKTGHAFGRLLRLQPNRLRSSGCCRIGEYVKNCILGLVHQNFYLSKHTQTPQQMSLVNQKECAIWPVELTKKPRARTCILGCLHWSITFWNTSVSQNTKTWTYETRTTARPFLLDNIKVDRNAARVLSFYLLLERCGDQIGCCPWRTAYVWAWYTKALHAEAHHWAFWSHVTWGGGGLPHIYWFFPAIGDNNKLPVSAKVKIVFSYSSPYWL